MRIGKRYTITGIRHDRTMCDICELRCDRDEKSWEDNDVEVYAKLGEVFPGQGKAGHRGDWRHIQGTGRR